MMTGQFGGCNSTYAHPTKCQLHYRFKSSLLTSVRFTSHDVGECGVVGVGDADAIDDTEGGFHCDSPVTLL